MSRRRKQESDPYADGSLLRYYRAVNEAYDDYLVYHLGPRGFCAETTSVARAMAYAWHHGLQLALDSSDFAYRSEVGWADYFESFCRDASEIPQDRVRERFNFHDRAHFVRLRAFRPDRLCFGVREINSLTDLLAHFTKLSFRLGEASRGEVESLTRSLGLGRNYVAMHVRRGDKVGDEDVFYPVELYIDCLDKLDDVGARPYFVMSDDFQVVEEVRRCLQSRGRSNRVASLCQPNHAGFSVKKLQAGEAFAGTDRPLESEADLRGYKWTETNRLLAEVTIGVRAALFVTTARSNVGRTVRFLRQDPTTSDILG